MKIDEVRRRAKEMGIDGINKMRKAELIRAVQSVEGNHVCFGAAWRSDCSQIDCSWRSDCQTANPG